MSIWAFWVEPSIRLRVKTWRIKRPDWTARPLKVAMIADIHACEPYQPLERLEQIVARTNALDADVICVMGDLLASHRFVTAHVPLEAVIATLGKLQAKRGVYGILGNHDWWDDTAAQIRGDGPCQTTELLETAGIPVLENRAIKVDDFWLAGLGDQLAFPQGGGRFRGVDDLPATMAQIADEAPVVLLAHEPDIFPDVPARAGITLSGHTHGGQLRLFGWSPVVPSRFGNRFAYGHVHEKGRDLIVSGGLGCSLMPLRFGVVPEITIVEITA